MEAVLLIGQASLERSILLAGHATGKTGLGMQQEVSPCLCCWLSVALSGYPRSP